LIQEVFERMRAAIDDIEVEVTRRRGVSAVDAVADGMAFAAQGFRAALAEIERDTEEISTEQYAAMLGVTPQSVCGWIRNGELEATRDSQSYRIRRNAKRVRRHLERAS
jgi:excisionase family DNA binding protein